MAGSVWGRDLTGAGMKEGWSGMFVDDDHGQIDGAFFFELPAAETRVRGRWNDRNRFDGNGLMDDGMEVDGQTSSCSHDIKEGTRGPCQA